MPTSSPLRDRDAHGELEAVGRHDGQALAVCLGGVVLEGGSVSGADPALPATRPSGSMTFILIRHAEATGQEPEAPLSARGHTDAATLAERLRNLGVSRVVSSPYRRAMETVAPFARSAGLPILEDPRLVEFKLAGAPRPGWREDLRRAFGDPELVLAGGESVLAARSRACAAVERALAEAPGRVAICTHGALAAILLGVFDHQAGFETWAALRTPDLFEVSPAGFERLIG